MSRQPTLLDDKVNRVAEPPAGFVLWFRPKRGRPWAMLARCETEREAWRRVGDDGRRGGDYTVLPAGQEP
jgi:hypothetical protein